MPKDEVHPAQDGEIHHSTTSFFEISIQNPKKEDVDLSSFFTKPANEWKTMKQKACGRVD